MTTIAFKNSGKSVSTLFVLCATLLLISLQTKAQKHMDKNKITIEMGRNLVTLINVVTVDPCGAI